MADVATTTNGVTSYTVGGSWKSTNADGQNFESITDVTNNTNKDCENEKLLIPLTDAKVSCNINLYYGGELIQTIAKTNVSIGSLQAGYAYNIVVSVGLTNEIRFTVEKNPSWADDKTITVQ